jgi:hypothetical protein
MSGAATLHEAQKRLDDGDGVLIFPEGTRSPRRGMNGFRRGAFELATRAQVPLWPMFISCEPPALARGVPIWKHPETAARQKLTPQPLMVPSSSASSRGLCRGVEGTCRRWLVDRGLADMPILGVALPLNVDEARASSYKLPSMAMEWEEQADDPR